MERGRLIRLAAVQNLAEVAFLIPSQPGESKVAEFGPGESKQPRLNDVDGFGPKTVIVGAGDNAVHSHGTMAFTR